MSQVSRRPSAATWKGGESALKSITLTQPWATLVVSGYKQIETRSWRTAYRGPLLIHAAKGFPREAREFAEEERAIGRLPARLPRGALIGKVELIACHPTGFIASNGLPGGNALSARERHFGDFSEGRWAWLLGNPEAFVDPVPMRGHLGLWECDLSEPL